MATANTNGFRVLPSYFEAIRDLPDAERLILYDAVWDFGFGNSVGELPPLLTSIFCLIKPTLEKSMVFEAKQKANGQKGGRPPKPKETQTKPRETQNDFGENLDIDIAVDSDIDIENAVGVDKADKPPRTTRFHPPTLEDVSAYCRERGNGIDAQRFIDYYTANGWRVGKNPMKDWRAAVRNWERGQSTDARRSANNRGDRGESTERDFGVKYDNELD